MGFDEGCMYCANLDLVDDSLENVECKKGSHSIRHAGACFVEEIKLLTGAKLIPVKNCIDFTLMVK